MEGDACVTLPKNMGFDALSRKYEKNKVDYCYEGQVVGTTKAKIKEVKKETKKEPEKKKDNSFLMKTVIVVVVLLIIGFAVLLILNAVRRKKRNRKH